MGSFHARGETVAEILSANRKCTPAIKGVARWVVVLKTGRNFSFIPGTVLSSFLNMLKKLNRVMCCSSYFTSDTLFKMISRKGQVPE